MRKRFGTQSLIWLALLLFLFSLPAVAQAKKSEIGQITGTGVNLRMEANQSSEAISKLERGSIVEVVEEIEISKAETWFRVVVDGKTGYVRSDMVLVRSVSDRVGYIVADGANLRGGPGQSAYVITRMSGGKSVSIQQMVGNWYYVKYQGLEGFVHSDLVELSRDQTTGSAYDMLLKFGMKGMAVKDLQTELAKRNFMDVKSVDGTYGDGTRSAVMEFQKLASLDNPDGTAGPLTLKALFDPNNSVKKPPKIPAKSDDFYGRVQTIDWWNGGNRVLKRPGGVCTVYDVKSGKSFKVRRTGGTNHNDGAPLTAKDTAIFKSILGGHWSHDKRPIIVVVGSKCYAASIYCMPHGQQVIKNNNYPGMLCIHFSNSRTHGGNRVDPLHKSNINYVFNKYKDKK